MNFNFYKKNFTLSIILYFTVFGYAQASSFNKDLTSDNKIRVETRESDKQIKQNRTLAEGSDCNNPVVVNLPGSLSGISMKIGETTKNLGNVYSDTDLGDFDNGQEKIYKFQTEEIANYDIKIDTYAYKVGIAVFEGCPSENNIIASSTNMNNGTQILENVLITKDKELYLMIDCIPQDDIDYVKFDLHFTKKPATVCEPAYPFVNEIKAKEARVEWTPKQGETKWDLKYEKKGFSPENQGNLIPDVTYPYILKNLEPDTEYDVYLRSKCSETSISNWSPSNNFKTEKDCETITEYPYLEDFTNGNTSLKCWTIIDANKDGEKEGDLVNGKWEFASNIARYSYSKENNADDWLISPRLYINQALELSFEYRAFVGGSHPEKFSVHVIEGESPNNYLSATEILSTITANSTAIKTIDAISLQNYINKQIYIAIKCESDKDMSSLAIDNFKIKKMYIPVETFNITASVIGQGGSITNSGITTVNKGDNLEFEIKADAGYVLESLTDDEVPKTVDAEGKYILTDIQKDHTIVVKFKASETPSETTFNITASVIGQGGSITNSGITTVNKGDNLEFEIKADAGYVLESLTDDEVPKTVDAEGKYILTDIQKDHIIVVKFKKTTSILENSSIELNIYPNPTNDYLNIQASEEIARIEILSLDGKILDKETINTNRYKYNINYLSEGNYLIRILGKNNITTKQFSVKRQ